MTKLAIRGAAVAAAAGVAIGALSTGAANADTFIPLPTDTASNTVGGSKVTLKISNQSARLSPGMVAVPTTRNAWVSGTISVTIDGAKADGGSIAAGYLVGCQINFGAKATAGASATPGLGFDGGGVTGLDGMGAKATGNVGGTITLSAGQVGAQYLVFDRATWPQPGDEISPDWNTPSNSFKFKGKSGSLSFNDQTIGVDQCAGYAQARFFAVVKAKVGNSEGHTTLWSKPFTLG